MSVEHDLSDSSKADFYAHIHASLSALLEGHSWWVSNLSQAASLLYHSYAGTDLYGLKDDKPVVNWSGFYLESRKPGARELTLGPFHGRPACVTIRAEAGKGVCADAFVLEKGVVVDDVDAYEGHIGECALGFAYSACDGDTRSEVVLPLRLKTKEGLKTVGVLDLDSTVFATFDEEDLKGLERVVEIIAEASEWE